ncbi:MAG TPA: alpha-amylase family glycosyl hydrolase [Labilithrix sp.]
MRSFPWFLLFAACGGASSPSSASSPPADPTSGAHQDPTPPPTQTTPDPTPPSGKRVGANVYDGGVEFRVWAPDAKSVVVTGDFGRRDLAAEADGYFGAKVDGAKAGQKYRFAVTGPDGVEVPRLDPRARAASGVDAIVVDPKTFAWKANGFTLPAREETVIYELHVGSFAVAPGADVGTFASAIGRLDTLADLGVNMIELMPVNLHGGKNGWGYNPQGWFATHPDYGTPDDLRRLVDEAHARGIGVMLDVVFNHYDGYSQAPLRCFDAPCASGGAGPYFFEPGPYAKTPWGPRPKYDAKAISDFLADDVYEWTFEYRIDGFRHDSVSNVRALDGQGSVPGGVDVLRRMNDVAVQTRPGALRIAEDLKGYAAVTAPSSAGGLGFDAQWAGLYDVVTALTAASDDARNLQAVRGAILGNYNGDPMQRLLYVETHDTAGNDGARLPAMIDANDPTSYAARKRSLVAAGVLLTTPGVPLIFMGQEMLESAKFVQTPPPLDWTKADTFGAVRAFYKDLIALRRSEPGLRSKDVTVTHVNDTSPNKVIAWRRNDVMIVANFSAKAYTRYDIGLPDGGTWRARIDGDDMKYGADFGSSGPTPVTVSAGMRDGLPFTGSLALGPYSVVVLTH